LFAIKKNGQRKTLSCQRKTLFEQQKTLSSQRKIWLGFQESVSFLVVFVFQKVISEEPFSKLSRVCLLLRKLINGKHFTVKGKFGLVSRKMFFLLAVFVFRKVVSRKSLSKLSCVCLTLEKLVNGKHFPIKRKFGLIFRKVFSWKIWEENTFRKL